MLDDFVTTCRSAAVGPDPLSAIRSAAEQLVASPLGLATDHPAPIECAAISGHSDYLFEDDNLTVVLVHTPPGVLQPPHDHAMPVVIAGYAGTELHRLFRRSGAGAVSLTPSGHNNVGPGEVFALGSNAVHAIDASPGGWSSAVHIYLGDLSSASRSLFNPETGAGRPFTADRYDDWCRPIAPG